MADVLVIDDDPAVAGLVKACLQTTYRVELCPSGRAALSILGKGARFKAILCDVHLPDLDGPALHEQIQMLDAAQAQRFLFVTGGMDDPRLSERVDRTRCKVILKPYRLDTLIETVRAVIECD
jgi:DNA-binding NtrC family response regulator